MTELEQKREVLAHLNKAFEAAGKNVTMILTEDGDTVKVTDLTTYEHRLINVAGDSCTMMIFDICRRIYDLWLLSLVLK